MRPLHIDLIETAFWCSFAASIGLVAFGAFKLGLFHNSIILVMQ
jgi:hypothetical protein